MPPTQPISISEDDYLEACDSNSGWCTTCQEFTGDFAEPDARKYLCEQCQQRTVYGAEEALLQQFITIE